MFERFTDRARIVMGLANAEVRRFKHGYLGTEHILLGLVNTDGGRGPQLLRRLVDDLAKVRAQVESRIKTGRDKASNERKPYDPHARNVIVHAIEEAKGLGHNYVGTEHILLGLLNERDSVAGSVLYVLGLSLDRAREELLTLLRCDPTFLGGMCSEDWDRGVSSAAIDVQLRGLTMMCRLMLPEERRTVDGVKAEMRRLLERALRDFEEDAKTFLPSEE